MKTHTFAICAYKDSPYLESCIKSLKAQTVPSHIILCTSTPSPFLHELAKHYQIPVFVREGDSDIQEDWNFAYDMADSQLVTIAHQDDMYQKDYVKILLEQWKKYPDMTVFTGDYVAVKHGELQKRGKVELVKKLLRMPLRIPSLNHIVFIKKSVLMMGNSICCPACTYHKQILGAPLFDSPYKFALDWDTLWRLALRPGRFICVETPVMYYRIHDEATTKACIADQRRGREEAEMFRKFWPDPFVKWILHFYRGAYDAYN